MIKVSFMKLFDTHTHYDDDKFDEIDRFALLQNIIY